MNARVRSLVVIVACSAACGPEPVAREPLGRLPNVVTTAEPEWIPFRVRAGASQVADGRERHLADLRRLTVGQGDNTEPRFSPDGRRLAFRSTREGCDQVFVMDLGSGATVRVSDGHGRAMQASFADSTGEHLVFAHATGAECQAAPPGATVVVPSELVISRVDGSERKVLVDSGAEPAISFDAKRLVFTSSRDGELDLYAAKPDGNAVRRLTNTPGYDGQAVFSPDGTKLAWSAVHPTGKDLDALRRDLAAHAFAPTPSDVVIGGADAQHPRLVTKSGVNRSPAFLADSRRILFASNAEGATPPSFDLYLVDPDGPPTSSGGPAVERITFSTGSDVDPAVSRDGSWVAFASSRSGSRPGEINLFVARWVDEPGAGLFGK